VRKHEPQVEDDSLTQHVICTLLNELTPKVTQAFDGEEGIAKCDTEQFDIIFMDMNMPKINGLEATCVVVLVCSVFGDGTVVAVRCKCHLIRATWLHVT
jgi:DNA-binding NarL/FixJ family response regulator